VSLCLLPPNGFGISGGAQRRPLHAVVGRRNTGHRFLQAHLL